MREIVLEIIFDDDQEPILPEGTGSCDWKEPPDEVLEIVDEQLKKFGLEVVMHENEWQILPTQLEEAA
jgi:hypothetical protein